MSYINASTAANRVKLIIIKQAELATEDTLPVEGDFIFAASNSSGAVTAVDKGGILLPGLQDITLNNSNGSFRWKQLDQSGENVITTNATNSVSGNFVLDPVTFFGKSFTTVANEAALPVSGMTIGTIFFATEEASFHVALTASTTLETNAKPAAADGIFALSNERTEIAFLLAPEGVTDGKKMFLGRGFISALAPTVTADAPVFLSPITIEVNGDYTVATASIAA